MSNNATEEVEETPQEAPKKRGCCYFCGVLNRNPLVAVVSFAILGIGIGLGLSFWEPAEGSDAKEKTIKWVGLVGDLFIRALKCVILPLVFINVCSASQMMAVWFRNPHITSHLSPAGTGHHQCRGHDGNRKSRISGLEDDRRLHDYHGHVRSRLLAGWPRLQSHMLLTFLSASIFGMIAIMSFQPLFVQGTFVPNPPPTVSLGCNTADSYLMEMTDGSVSCAVGNSSMDATQFVIEDVTGSFVRSEGSSAGTISLSDTIYAGKTRLLSNLHQRLTQGVTHASFPTDRCLYPADPR